MSREPNDTLELTSDEMRRLGYAAMDLIIGWRSRPSAWFELCPGGQW